VPQFAPEEIRLRILKLTVLVAGVVLFGCSGRRGCAENYCADL